jgi:hypothetical protein
MDGTSTTMRSLTRPRKWIVSTALLAGGLVAGVTLATGPMANAADTSGTSGTSGTTQPSTPQDPTAMRHGPGETPLDGTAASKIQAAAEATVDGTVLRVETDSGGAAYEAHIQKADGSVVTVTFDKDMQVTGTFDGFGQAPQA